MYNSHMQEQKSLLNAAEVPEEILVGIVADIAKESIRCFTDYLKCREFEETERRRIAAQLRAINEAINAKKEMFIASLEKNHENIVNAYQLGNKVMESALKTSNMEMVKETFSFLKEMTNIVGNNTDGIISKFLNDNNNTMLLK